MSRITLWGCRAARTAPPLAIYLRDRVPDVEYFFCDTGAELPETYEFLNKLEAYFGRRIARLNSGRDFDHWLDVYRGTLPSPQMRWCTAQMNRLLEEWIQKEFGSERVVSYVAIRSDEPSVKATYPRKRDSRFGTHFVRMESTRMVYSEL